MLWYLLPENNGSIVLLRFAGGEGTPPTTLRASTSIIAQVMCDFMRLAFRSLISHKTFILNRHHHLNLKFNDYFIKKNTFHYKNHLLFLRIFLLLLLNWFWWHEMNTLEREHIQTNKNCASNAFCIKSEWLCM